MSEDKRTPTIERLVLTWKDEHGVWATGKMGTLYKKMPSSSMHENLRILARTMLDAGYTFEEIDDYHVALTIADICWREDKITTMTSSEIVRAKKSLTRDWNEVISASEFSGIVMSKVEPQDIETEEKPTKERTKEELMEAIFSTKSSATPTPKIDRTDTTNWELLAELGLEPDKVDNE
jgi:hypothetical protein